MPFTRIAGYAGFAFVTLLVGVNVVLGASGRPLEATAPIDDVFEWFASSRAVVDLVTFTAPLIWIGMTIFAVGLLFATRAADGTFNPWAFVGMVGVTMQHAIFSRVIGTDAVLAAQEGDAFAGLVYQLHHAPFSLNNASIAIALGGFAMASLAARFVPPWVKWAGIVGVIGLLANAMQTSLLLRGDGFFVLGIIGFAGWAVFVVVASLRLVRSDRSVAPTV